ncbi:MAG: DNA polymerase III subunit gamma/tau [Spirochaetes bacterium]|nr:DNA polymerase III subunit gamma/tau [Spirochaetota bacterium]
MSYVVSARRYRPQLFDELVGQEHIANTLKNAITRGRVGHAYLFSGPRGIGKTSAARIFAKALNCESGPTPTPCNRCVFCTEITEGRALDLVEIDGASNRRIDEVRQIRENVRFSPSSARYKIYIIDEVHMLTTEAFNALLKTLEEPPHHVVFVFATTEVDRVPATIRSRCQQFVFKRVPVSLIIPLLERILKDLDVEADPKALFWIARAAAGSVRDAESILDQMISYSEGRIEQEDVFYVLGLPGYDVYHRFANFFSSGDRKGSITLLARLMNEGYEPLSLVSGLIEYFRNLNILALDKSADKSTDRSADRSAESWSVDLIDLPETETERMKETLEGFSSGDIANVLTLLTKTYLDMKNSELGRELFEIALIKLTRYREIVDPASLVKRLEELGSAVAAKSADCGNHFGEKEPENGGSPGRLQGGTPARDMENESVECVEDTPGASLFSNKRSDGDRPEEEKPSIFDGDAMPQQGFNGDSEAEIAERVVSHFSKKRRAIAEFLGRAKRYHYGDNLLTIHYDGTQRLSFAHVSEDSTRRYIEKEIQDYLQKNIRVSFTIDAAGDADEEKNRLSSGVSKVLEIFKGEIVSKNNTGGQQ